MSTGLQIAERLARLPKLAVILTRDALDVGGHSSFSEQLHLEMCTQQRLFRNPETIEVLTQRTKQFREATKRRESKL